MKSNWLKQTGGLLLGVFMSILITLVGLVWGTINRFYGN